VCGAGKRDEIVRSVRREKIAKERPDSVTCCIFYSEKAVSVNIGDEMNVERKRERKRPKKETVGYG